MVQLVQACLGLLLITEFEDPRTQVLETVQTSLFFLLVDSVWYRLKALREGDRYFLKTLIYEARHRAFHEFLLFIMGYCVLTSVVIMIGFFESQDGAEFTPFKVFIYLIEGAKLIFD